MRFFTNKSNTKEAKRNDIQSFMEAMCASHAIAWFTPDAKLFEANDRFCAIFEYDAADITGITHDDFVAPSVRGTETDEAFFGAFQGHGLFADTVPRQTETGRMIWLQTTYVPSKNSGGSIYKIATISRDVSQAQLKNTRQARTTG